jgi:hypothetical protein
MPLRHPALITTLVAGAFFMENLDGTIIASARPQMARSFHWACRPLEFTCMTTLAHTAIAPEEMSQANEFLSAVNPLALGTDVAVGP